MIVFPRLAYEKAGRNHPYFQGDKTALCGDPSSLSQVAAQWLARHDSLMHFVFMDCAMEQGLATAE
jgi:hypothetical protein